MISCLPPVLGDEPKALILGSMPGKVSLLKQQYYAHKQNQFWKLVGAALNADLQALPYEKRLAALKERGLGLWDVFQSCERESSLDSDIEGAEPNPIPKLLRENPSIKTVFLNGGTAWRAFQQAFADSLPTGVEAHKLPSTSPAHAGMTFEDKLKHWTRIALGLTLLLAAAPTRAAELTLYDIVDKANKALRGDSSHGRMTMTIVTPKWKRVMEVEGWNRAREYAFIMIHAPAKEKGNITLRRKNEMWVWLPKVERVIKVPPTMMHSSWQGSDFTYEDIVKADSVVKDYTHKLLDKKPDGERVIYKIQGDPKPDAPVVWGKIIMDVAVYGDEAVPLREEDYSERGQLERTIVLSEIKRMGGRLLPAKLECVPTRKPGQKTTLEYHSLEFDIPLEDSFFSLSKLQKGAR